MHSTRRSYNVSSEFGSITHGKTAQCCNSLTYDNYILSAITQYLDNPQIPQHSIVNDHKMYVQLVVAMYYIYINASSGLRNNFSSDIVTSPHELYDR